MGDAPGLIIAAPASGAGKTTLTLALLRALANAGVAVRSAKVGPDYIDPAFHAAASGHPCPNLDPWAMSPGRLRALAGDLASACDLLLIEGVMGLFDGARDGTGATADLAALLGLPVLLVVDVRGQGASVAALVEGFSRHRGDVEIAGVIVNRTGGPAHEEILRKALLPTGLPVLGAVPRADLLALPERHLGLVPAGEHEALLGFLDRAAALVAGHVDLPALQRAAWPVRSAVSAASAPLPLLGQRIAVARDVAFAFAYPHLLDDWRRQGAEIRPFSPLADEAPDPAADAIFLPGGYPELHAGPLAAATHFRAGMALAAGRGATIYGECGGYMVLGEGLVDRDGARHAMLGLLPVETSFARRALHLGYRLVQPLAGQPFGEGPLRGHEFHYASVLREGEAPALFACRDALGRELAPAGRCLGTVSGSFLHIIDHGPA